MAFRPSTCRRNSGNHSDEYVGLAVQGPECREVFSRVIPGVELPPRNGISRITAEGTDLIICRTGYTGEDGFEFFCPAKEGVKWFEAFLGAGTKPCGLGAATACVWKCAIL